MSPSPAKRFPRPCHSRKFPIRKFNIAALSLIALLIVYSGWWLITSRALERQIERWITAQQAEGARISPDHVSIRGYPFGFAITLTDASIAWPNGLAFAPRIIKLRAHPWSSRRILVSVTGGYSVAIPPGDTRPPLTLAGETLRGRANFADGPIPLTLSLNSDTISVAETANDSGSRELTVASLVLNASRPEAPAKADTDVALDVSLAMMDVSAAAIESNPLGGVIKDMRIHAQLLGVPPATADAAGLEAWRDAGGSIDASDLAIDWGPLGLSANGALALDKNMQPEGAFTAHLTGVAEALDAFAAAGWIKMGVASLAKLGLGLAARPGANGKPAVTTPVTIQNRQISLGAFKLGQIPLLHLD